MPMPKSRPPLARMMVIHQALLRMENPNCSVLAARLEVSSKTIQRDLVYMRDQLGLPVAYDSGERGYFYDGEVHSFPNLLVTEGEVLALFLAQQALTTYAGTSLEGPLRSAMTKLSEILGDTVSIQPDDFGQDISFHHTGTPVIAPDVFQRIQTALLDRREVHFSYRKPGAEADEDRVVCPYHLGCINGQWYLFGHDNDREAMRTFALSRVQEVRGTGATFERPEDFSISRYLVDSFGVFTGRGQEEVRIRFAPEVAQLVRERQWHASQELTDLGEEGLVLQMRLNDLTEVANWVLSWGRFAEVITPEQLREEVLKTAEAMRQHYIRKPSERRAPRVLDREPLLPETSQLLEYALRQEHPGQLHFAFGRRSRQSGP